MWKELRELIRTRVGERSHSRRTRPSKFRGKFEQLETRAVLSATVGPTAAFGVMSVDFEAGTMTIAVWASHPQFSDSTPIGAFRAEHQFDKPDFDGALLSKAPLTDSFDGRDDFEGRDDVFALLNRGPGSYGLIDTGRNFLHLPPPGSGMLGDGTLKSSLREALDIESGGGKGGDVPLMSQYLGEDQGAEPDLSNVNLDFGNSTTRRPELPRPLRIVTVSLPSLLAVPEAADSNADVPTKSTLVRNAAFDEYSPGSLLLAANVDDETEDDELGLSDDERDAESDAPADKSALALVENAGESLDALEREQAAIDEVLAELHDLNLRQDDPSTDSASTNNQAQSHSTREAVEDSLRTYDQEFGSDNFSQAEGGMVLLEPTGDANSSAYDLTAVFTGKFARPHEVALGLEATVGLQQAFDVGSNERFESTGARTPVAQPAAASAQPSVSAENAPAKKSEQPS